MIKYILCIGFFFSVGFESFAQEDLIDKRYLETTLSLFSLNAQEASHIADSLMHDSDTQFDKIKLNLVSSIVHFNLGEYSLAIKQAQTADKFSRLIGLKEYEIGSAILLSSIYGELGLIEESTNYLDRATTAIKEIQDSSIYCLLELQLNQEKAKILMSSDRFGEAHNLINTTILKKENKYATNLCLLLMEAESQLTLSYCSNQMGNPSRSLALVKKTLENLDGIASLIKPKSYLLLADTYHRLGQGDSSEVYLGLVRPYIDSSNNVQLKRLYYFQKAKILKESGADKDALEYFDKYLALVEQNHNLSREISNSLLKVRSDQILLLKKKNLVLVWTLIIVISALGSYYFLKIYLLRSRRNSSPRTLSTIVITESNSPSVKRHEKETSTLNLDSQMSLETETRLVKKLNELEDEKFFLDKLITLGTLTNKINSNQKYVSYIIRKYKNQHFNDYILNLRIQYIVKQLESNKIMLDYKLSYLAEMAGFISHSKFTLAFKTVMNTTPSQFIEQLKAKSE